MGRKRKLKKQKLGEITEEEIKQIIELFDKQKTLYFISTKVKVGKALVRKILNKNGRGITVKSEYKKSVNSLTKEEKYKIWELRQTKMTPSQISKSLKIDVAIVRLVISITSNKILTKKYKYASRSLVGIYMIKNDITGKVYIGQSNNLMKRWKEHILNKNGSHNQELYNDMLEYGIAAFSYKLLIGHPQLTKTQLFKLENCFIRHFDSTNPEKGYNKLYSNYGFYDIDLKGKTTEEILDFVFTVDSN